jgi:hypothetical protein
VEGLLAPFTEPGFAWGLLFGATGLVAGIAAAALWSGRRPLPIAGSLLVGAALAGLGAAERLPIGLVLGLGLLVAGGVFADRFGRSRTLEVIAALPGAVALVVDADLSAAWQRALVGTAILIGGPLAAGFGRRWQATGWGPPLVAMSAAGVFWTVPDTEEAVVFLGAALPIAFLGWPRPLASLGTGGAHAVMGLVAWTAAVGGVGRPGSAVGAVACLGVLAAEPIARALGSSHEIALDRAAGRWWGPLPLSVLHLVLVYLGSRVAGLRPSFVMAAVIAGAAIAGGIALFLVAGGVLNAATARRSWE